MRVFKKYDALLLVLMLVFSPVSLALTEILPDVHLGDARLGRSIKHRLASQALPSKAQDFSSQGQALFPQAQTLSSQRRLGSSVVFSNLVVTSQTDGLNLHFKLSDHVDYKGFLLSNPSRFVIDFKNARLNTSLDQPILYQSYLRSVHSAYNKNILRMVFEFNQASKIKITQLKLNDLNNKNGESKTKQAHELVLEFIKKSPGNMPAVKKEADADLNLPKTNDLEKLVEDAQYTKNTIDRSSLEKKQTEAAQGLKATRDIIVVIDPGHGGEDPGAVGASGAQEKKVVLAIASELARLLNNEPGFHAILTRRGDYFLPLGKRLKIARQYRADMFIAVHADAYMNNEAHGASVYSLSNRGATSTAARWLAEKENHSELLDGAKLRDDGSMLRSVLLNLQQTATIAASLQLGNYILDYLGRCTQLHHNKIEQAAFLVLKSPDICSLLVETGFISNKTEESLLTQKAYQEQLAAAINEGIKDYYHFKPPGGTFLSALMGRV